MSEQENQNEFNIWDSAGAAGFLVFTMAVLCYVFFDHNLQWTFILIGAAGCAAVVCFIFAWLLGSHNMNRILQWAGNILCLVLWGVAIYMWANSHKFDAVRDKPAQQVEITR